MKHMTKAALVFLATAALMALLAAAACAVPALSVEQAFTQPGAGTFYGTPCGDELFHYVKARDGAILTQGEGGVWSHAGTDARYLLETPPAPVSEAAWVARQAAAYPAPDRSGLLQDFSGGGGGRLQAVAGEQPLLVILVDFRDVQIRYEDRWAAQVFGEEASVRRFFSDATGGKISIVPARESYGGAGAADDGVVRVALNYNHPKKGDERTTRDAVAAAAPYVDFAAYDRNNDKKITSDELHIVVVCAGYEGAYGGGPSPNVWGYHHSDGSFGSADGRTITAYMQIGEVHMQASALYTAHMATIGILCHELGHNFGLPDLYGNGTGRGLGGLSLMSNGSWGWVGDQDQGESPVYPDAYCLELLGAVPVQALAPGERYAGAVRSISTGDKNILRLNIPGSAEYFLIENRQPEMNDLALWSYYVSEAAGGGVAVYRINTNYGNNLEDGKQVATLLEADGRNLLQGGALAGLDPFYYVRDARPVRLNRYTAPSTALQGGGSGWFDFTCKSEPDPSMDIELNPILSASPTSMTLDYRSGKGKITVTGVVGTARFTSGNTGIATVDGSGNVSAARRGKGATTIIVADDSDFSDTVTVTVKYIWWQWFILILLFGWAWY